MARFTGRLRRFCSLAALAAVTGTAACAQTFDAQTLGVEALMATPATTPPKGDAFRLSHKAVFLVLGAIPLSRPSLRRELATQVVGDQKIANLRIRVRSRWSDVLITALTAGLIVPRTVTFEGIIVNQ